MKDEQEMTFEEYEKEISSIHDRIQKIAERTANQAFANCANPENPIFVELMRRHAELTIISSTLTEKMISRMKTGAIQTDVVARTP